MISLDDYDDDDDDDNINNELVQEKLHESQIGPRGQSRRKDQETDHDAHSH